MLYLSWDIGSIPAKEVILLWKSIIRQDNMPEK